MRAGQLGRVAVIGGSEDYTGAPYFSAMASARLGCDMVCYLFYNDIHCGLANSVPAYMVEYISIMFKKQLYIPGDLHFMMVLHALTFPLTFLNLLHVQEDLHLRSNSLFVLVPRHLHPDRSNSHQVILAQPDGAPPHALLSLFGLIPPLRRCRHRPLPDR